MNRPVIVSEQSSVQHTAKAGVAVFAALCFVSLLFFSGDLNSSDEVLMAETSRSLATRFSLVFEEPVYGQVSTGYGIGTPLAGVPFVWLSSLTNSNGESFLPLANGILFALTGLFCFLIVSHLLSRIDSHRVAAGVVTIMIASPLLPASTTFYSEMLSAASLTGFVACMFCATSGKHRWVVIAFLCMLFGVLSRVAMVPLLAFVLGWGCRYRATSRFLKITLSAGLFGIVAGIICWMAVNVILRGSPFASGYKGQAFTTPLITGIHGLLFSPERGLCVFFPAVAGLVMMRNCCGLRTLAVCLLGFSIVFHSVFWTWHGGGTMGPRFLLPVIAAAVPVLAVALCDERASPVLRRAVIAMLLWSAWGGVLYSLFNPVTWWNETKPFHGVENRWLFEPQLSLWRNWEFLAQESLFRAVFPVLFGRGTLVVFLTGAAVLAVVSMLAAIAAGKSLQRLTRPALITTTVLTIFALTGALRGPRGWVTEDGEVVRSLRVADQPARLTAIFDATIHRGYRLVSKASGSYRLSVDGFVVLQGANPTPHLSEGNFQLQEPGPVLLEAEFRPPAGEGGWLQVFWTWPGEGRSLEPVGGEYVFPRNLTIREQIFTKIWRHAWIFAAGGLALVLLFSKSRGGSPEGDVERP